ncbi:MAG: hypothetical protein ACLRSD_03050 [Oscillibacter sp.]
MASWQSHGEAVVRDRNVANFALLFRLERRVVQAVFSTRLRAEVGAGLWN